MPQDTRRRTVASACWARPRRRVDGDAAAPRPMGRERPEAALVAALHPASPLRDPAWRWGLARHLAVGAERRLWRYADKPVRVAIAYLRTKAHRGRDVDGRRFGAPRAA